MKPLLMRHSEPINESFKIWENSNPYLHNPWHYHPECEITYIFKGNGILFVGDQKVSYNDDDVVILGPNLPHEWRSNIQDDPDLYSLSISLHFDQYLLGSQFYKLPEVSDVATLLDLSVCGIKIEDAETKKRLKTILTNLRQASGMTKIYMLLEVLHTISQSPGLTNLSSNSFLNSVEQGHDYRINQVYAYVMKNFSKTIMISDVASIISMTETSFCRFFKERTHKSFMRYLHEIRVGYSCKLLLEGNYSISQIAYKSGFGNMSNFNKQFKKVKNITPSSFLKDYI